MHITLSSTAVVFFMEKGTLTSAMRYIGLKTIVEAMLKSDEKWPAVVRYSLRNIGRVLLPTKNREGFLYS